MSFPNMVMSKFVMDESELRKLSIQERFAKCNEILRTSDDESLRWDAVWLAGEIAEKCGSTDPMFEKVSDLMCWVLENDDNGVVKHEAAFQIAARNMRNKIPDLINSVLNDKSGLVKHEALEALGLMQASETRNFVSKALADPNPDVYQTAAFVIKRFDRLKHLAHEYKPSEII